MSKMMIDSEHSLQEKIVEALRSIYDPEIPVNIYDLGLIYTIDVNPDCSVNVQMTLTSPNCPVAETFPQQVQDRLLAVPGVSGVKIELVFEPAWTKDNMSEEVKLQLNLL